MSMPAENQTCLPLLSDLLHGIAEVPEIKVRGLATDSREVKDGYLFLACQGIGSHGFDYVEAALKNGAAVVLFDTTTTKRLSRSAVPIIGINDLADHVGTIASRFYAEPSQALDVVGVTGTNGKTTVAWMVAACLKELGRQCGYVGTLGAGLNNIESIGGMTTPSTVDMHAVLAKFLDGGATHAAVEVSSHALSQRRVDAVRFKAALFTNLSRDHLDYHGDMESYFEAKAALFLAADPEFKIVNVDTDYGARLADQCGKQVVCVSSSTVQVVAGSRFVSIAKLSTTVDASRVSFDSSWGPGQFDLRMPGQYNVANALLVVAYLLVTGFSVDESCDCITNISAPPGRMQRVAAGDPAVFIDYAHTPDALAAALTALRPHTVGKLWCVYGCGGERDQGKRAQMGAIVEAHADAGVITTDNPRHEVPRAIIDDILSGLKRPKSAVIVEDRATAIAWSIGEAVASDTVLIAGKGHEEYQQIGNERRPFSDYQVADAALIAKAETA